jgi:hypothetical protein
MSVATNDPVAVRNLLLACEQYQAGSLAIEELQGRVANTEMLITSVEESGFRKLLSRVEGQLELILFTMDREKIRESALPVVQSLVARIHSHLAQA